MNRNQSAEESEGRDSRRSSVVNDGRITEDEEVLALMGVSDGYVPSDQLDRQPLQTLSIHKRHSSNVHPYRSLQPVPVPPPRPSSTSKPSFDFTLRHDGATDLSISRHRHISNSNVVLSPLPDAASETSSRAERSQHDTARISSPNQSRPADSRLARSPSVATTSTFQPVQERAYTGPSGPSHAYSIYPQNVVTDAESAQDPQAPIPIGFPGMSGASYQRRLGPDGEDLPMVGPLGEQEDLPPYTQYPAGRQNMSGTTQTARPDPTTTPLLPPDTTNSQNSPSGATVTESSPIDPVRATSATGSQRSGSREDLTTPNSQLSSQSLTLADSGTPINEAPMSEKTELKSWQKFLTKKICGVFPAWALMLVALVLVVFAIVLGAMHAALRSKHPPKHPQSSGAVNGSSVSYTTLTLTTTFDATALTSVPTGIPALPTGAYALPSIPATWSRSACINASSHAAAWSCAMPEALSYQLIVSLIPGQPLLRDIEASLEYTKTGFSALPFGAQPPLMANPQEMSLTNAYQSQILGPAWFFQVPYNKMVVVPDSELSGPPNSKRSQILETRFLKGRSGTVEPGDHPWICYWNGTLLEVFIYANSTNSLATSAPSSNSSPSSTGAGSAPSSTGVSDAYATAYGNPKFLATYPRVVRIEERRVKGFLSVPAYCVQQNVGPEGGVSPRLNASGQPITIGLDEIEHQIGHVSSASSLSLRTELNVSITQDNFSSCSCVWVWE